MPFQHGSHDEQDRIVDRVGVGGDPRDRVDIAADRLSDHGVNAVVGHGPSMQANR